MAPLLRDGDAGPILLGPCLLVRAGDRVVGFTSRTVVERDPASGDAVHRVPARLDGTTSYAARVLRLSRYSGVVELELEGADPEGWPDGDVAPLDPSRIGTLDHAKRGAPFVVAVAAEGGAYARIATRIHVATVESASFGGSGDDAVYHLARERDPRDRRAIYDGAPVFARHAASRVLDRPAETLAYGIACATPEGERDDAPPHERSFAELVPIPVHFAFGRG